MKNTNDFTLRLAIAEDAPLILEFIRELAHYEKMSDQVVATEELLLDTLFTQKRAEVLIGEYQGNPVAFALFFHNFSTFIGKPGIYLEDLYVKENYRGMGFGKKILTALAQLAKERDCGRLEWACLNWNTPSIGFYKSLGSTPMNEWTVYRLQGEALDHMAEGIR